MRSARRERWRGWSRPRSGIAGFAAALVVSGACQQRTEMPEPVPEPGGTLRIAIFEPVDFLTPARSIRPLTRQIMVHITPPLGRVNEQGYADLLLARRMLDTGEAYLFRLRPVRWEDGRPVTAKDLVMTQRMVLGNRQPDPERNRFDLMRDLVARDDSTLLIESSVALSTRLENAMIMPLPAHVLGDSADPAQLSNWPVTRVPLSCGPFRVVESSTFQLRLARNDSSGFPPPYLDALELRTLGVDEAVRDFADGHIDVVDDLPVGRVPEVQRVEGAHVVALVGRSYLFMGWNLHDARFGDAAVRRAAAHAMDVAALIDALTLKQGDPARGPLVPASGYVDTTSVLPHDVALAKAILEQAGWRDEDGDGVRERRGARLSFFILVPEDNALRVETAQMLSKQLMAVGIEARMRAMPSLDFLARIEARDFEAYMGHWFPDLHGDLSPVWHSESTRFNFGGYANPRVDSLLVMLRYEEADTWRRQTETELQRRVYADQPVLFLFQVPRFVAFSRRVRGHQPNVLSTFWNLPEWWIPRDEQRQAAQP